MHAVVYQQSGTAACDAASVYLSVCACVLQGCVEVCPQREL